MNYPTSHSPDSFESRLFRLNNKAINTVGAYVLYWMQQSQRTRFNHALEYAIAEANRLHLPVLACFAITPAFPDANARHYTFMLEGLLDVAQNLKECGIGFVVKIGSPAEIALELSRDAALIVCDRGYLRIQRQWRSAVAKNAPCAAVELESDVVVPLGAVLEREAYSAAVLRPRINRLLDQYLLAPTPLHAAIDSTALSDTSLIKKLLGDLSPLGADCTVRPVDWICGGENEAAIRLDEFIGEKLDHFGDLRNDPGKEYGSHMSPYLHFGNISPVQIALAVRKARSPGTDRFLEELVVRRELSMNMVWYNNAYDSLQVLPAWALATLEKHQTDPRSPRYTMRELESARTHDPYWNAAQTEMIFSGSMHGYMRMYWGKKILEWSDSAAKAYKAMVTLNNRYFLDGRDANGYAGIAWCLGKHDRPWKERSIFGTIRYMNAAGLQRKFDIDGYVQRIAALASTHSGT